MSDKEKAQHINTLCKKHRCSETKAEIHFDQFVNRDWNPHPSQRFLAWFSKHPEHELNPVPAFNSQYIFDEYTEAKKLGVA